MCACWSLRRVRLFATPQTVARPAPLSRGFSRQEYWSRLPCPPPGDLPNPGTEPWSPALQADSLLFQLQGSPVTHRHSFLNVLFHYSLSQDTEFSSLCTVGPWCRAILHRTFTSASPELPVLPSPPLLPLGTTGLSPVSASLFLFKRAICQIPSITDIIWYLSFSFGFNSLSMMHPCYCKWHDFILFND